VGIILVIIKSLLLFYAHIQSLKPIAKTAPKVYCFLLSFKIAVPTALKADSISWYRTTSSTNVKEWKERS
jgi:hypothetical protein